MLKFSFGNTKMKKLAVYMGLFKTLVVAFDIPAGFSCPKASLCQTFANKVTGKLQRVGKVLCYASKAENYLPSVRRLRWHNYDLLLACKNNINELVCLINGSLPKRVKVVRIHSSGDFYCKEYFLAWCEVARLNPDITFFGYTKILDYCLVKLPDNMFLNYSYGSKDDERYNAMRVSIPTCFIAEYEGQYPTLPVVCGENGAHEDFFMIISKQSFVLNIH